MSNLTSEGERTTVRLSLYYSREAGGQNAKKGLAPSACPR